MVPICLACEYWFDEYNFFCTNCKHCTTKMYYKNEEWKENTDPIEIEASL